ncbi:ThiF family adenylyltransferase [Halomontanus rarus]|uniref:ThiF family adenylyltransferase n=1 Tax=Halomontanus rarus TaxID=3034020 RepID=UPI001A98D0AB
MSGSTATTTPQTTIRIPAPAVTALRDALLRPDGRERVAFGYCSRSGNDLLLTEVEQVPDENHRHSSPGSCRPTTACEREFISRCTSRDLHPVFFHSHPFTDTAWFSTLDRQLIDRFRKWLTTLYPDRDLLFGVLGHEEMRIERVTADDSRPVAVDIKGEWELEQPVRPTHTAAPDAPAVDTERFDRHLRAFGEAGQTKLANTHVAVVGCGGIGSILAQTLARLGIGKLTLIDPDEIEVSNLPRLPGCTHGDVGQLKVSAMHQRCWEANPDCDIISIARPVQETEDYLKNADIIVAGVDRVTARYWVNQFAVRHLIPYVDAGTVIETSDADPPQIESMEVYIQTIVPGVTACFDCLDRGDPDQAYRESLDSAEEKAAVERGYIDADIEPEPAVIDLNQLAAAHTVSAVKRLALGTQPPVAFRKYDDVSGDQALLETHPNASCPTCLGNSLALGDSTISSAADQEIATAPLDDAALANPLEQTDRTTRDWFPPAVTAFFASDLAQHPTTDP